MHVLEACHSAQQVVKDHGELSPVVHATSQLQPLQAQRQCLKQEAKSTCAWQSPGQVQRLQRGWQHVAEILQRIWMQVALPLPDLQSDHLVPMNLKYLPQPPPVLYVEPRATANSDLQLAGRVYLVQAVLPARGIYGVEPELEAAGARKLDSGDGSGSAGMMQERLGVRTRERLSAQDQDQARMNLPRLGSNNAQNLSQGAVATHRGVEHSSPYCRDIEHDLL
mmetsp:Transcript_18634/g.38772  ORF Transcript_18634/g.38772 Transcript_18634/m.38772 type:complete len:223 (+) Transcript_18634:148-816(+)